MSAESTDHFNFIVTELESLHFPIRQVSSTMWLITSRNKEWLMPASKQFQPSVTATGDSRISAEMSAESSMSWWLWQTARASGGFSLISSFSTMSWGDEAN